jgi:alkane 1-monooxygenase
MAGAGGQCHSGTARRISGINCGILPRFCREPRLVSAKAERGKGKADVKSSESDQDDAMLQAIRAAAGTTAAPEDGSVRRGKPELRVVGEETGTPERDPAPVAAHRPASATAAARRPRPDAETGPVRASKVKAPRKPSRVLAALKAEAARWRPLAPFALATLAPVPLLVLAAVFGGGWVALALLWMTGLTFAIDEFAQRRGIEAPGPRPEAEANRLSAALAVVHFPLLMLAVWSLSGAAGHGVFGWIGTFLGFGLWFGQVSNSNAHELVHRTERRLFRLGMWIFISLLFGHHTSAHRLVHHRFVATTDDPNTAAKDENFYRFAARAWPGAFVAGFEMEAHRLGGTGFDWKRPNPYLIYVAGGLGCVIGVTALFGFDGLLAYLFLCAHAQIQLLLSDYVQHYGLLREKLPSGTLMPAGPQHSWDAPHPLSALMMLNAPRHADHHAHPGRPYTELALSPGGRAPLLPYSLPVMATFALIPTLWFRVMNPRLALLKRRGAA